jgi:coxsackievirus/adenovirus receptor
LENVEGRRCDHCKENKHDRQRGCVDCPACYSLVQNEVNAHRNSLETLETLLKDLIASPTVIDNADFDIQLKNVQDRVQQLLLDAKRAAGGIHIYFQYKNLSAFRKQFELNISYIFFFCFYR